MAPEREEELLAIWLNNYALAMIKVIVASEQADTLKSLKDLENASEALAKTLTKLLKTSPPSGSRFGHDEA